MYVLLIVSINTDFSLISFDDYSRSHQSFSKVVSVSGRISNLAAVAEVIVLLSVKIPSDQVFISPHTTHDSWPIHLTKSPPKVINFASLAVGVLYATSNMILPQTSTGLAAYLNTSTAVRSYTACESFSFLTKEGGGSGKLPVTCR